MKVNAPSHSSKHFWLLKSEPSAFSIDDLAKRPKQIEPWNGVRNYQARNFLRQMQKGDLGFFYHSSCAEPGIVGIVKIVKTAYPDDTAFDHNSQYFDAKSTSINPRWFCVDVQLIKKFKKIISLKDLKQQPRLAHIRLLQPGNRLSVLPVTPLDWEFILRLNN